MKIKSLLFSGLLILISLSESSAQTAEDSVSYHPHQIGFNATETISLFEEGSDTYELQYRYKLNPKTALRSGLNYSYDSGDGGQLTVDLKLGIDKRFEKSEQWRFYTGVDLVGGISTLSNSSRKNYKLGLTPFLGAIFYLDEHFSISTEPGLLVQYRRYKNSDSFNPDNSDSWVKMDLVNVGQIIIGIHF